MSPLLFFCKGEGIMKKLQELWTEKKAICIIVIAFVLIAGTGIIAGVALTKDNKDKGSAQKETSNVAVESKEKETTSVTKKTESTNTTSSVVANAQETTGAASLEATEVAKETVAVSTQKEVETQTETATTEAQPAEPKTEAPTEAPTQAPKPVYGANGLITTELTVYLEYPDDYYLLPKNRDELIILFEADDTDDRAKYYKSENVSSRSLFNDGLNWGEATISDVTDRYGEFYDVIQRKGYHLYKYYQICADPADQLYIAYSFTDEGKLKEIRVGTETRMYK